MSLDIRPDNEERRARYTLCRNLGYTRPWAQRIRDFRWSCFCRRLVTDVLDLTNDEIANILGRKGVRQ